MDSILFAKSLARLSLPSASLSTLYSKDEPIVCSTSSAIGKGQDDNDWDDDLVRLMTLRWYPFGITPHRSLQRILPNHYLDLQIWKSVRHWLDNPVQSIDQSEIGCVIASIADQIIGDIDSNIQRQGLRNIDRWT